MALACTAKLASVNTEILKKSCQNESKWGVVRLKISSEAPVLNNSQNENYTRRWRTCHKKYNQFAAWRQAWDPCDNYSCSYNPELAEVPYTFSGVTHRQTLSISVLLCQFHMTQKTPVFFFRTLIILNYHWIYVHSITTT